LKGGGSWVSGTGSVGGGLVEASEESMRVVTKYDQALKIAYSIFQLKQINQESIAAQH
jgi:hypothetical protein